MEGKREYEFGRARGEEAAGEEAETDRVVTRAGVGGGGGRRQEAGYRVHSVRGPTVKADHRRPSLPTPRTAATAAASCGWGLGRVLPRAASVGTPFGNGRKWMGGESLGLYGLGCAWRRLL